MNETKQISTQYEIRLDGHSTTFPDSDEEKE